MAVVDVNEPRTPNYVRQELESIKPFCRWTSGRWEDLDGIRWNELQNIPSHIRILSNYLVRIYLDSRKSSL